MKIYTKGGDQGETGLLGGDRIAKNHPRMIAIGEVDEVNATIGMARSQNPPEKLDLILGRVQSELFVLGGHLACLPGSKFSLPAPSSVFTAELEAWIDQAQEELPPLKNFILPGGTTLAANLHLARSVARRAERAVFTLSQEADIDPESLVFLNRLSDWLFVAARWANHQSGESEIIWKPNA